jgi:hypothetical protein
MKHPWDEDRCYHGVMGEFTGRIFIEHTEFGPSAREPGHLVVIGEASSHEGGYTWGYIGTGPRDTANAVLMDATGWNEIPRQLASDFVEDVVSQLADQWRLRRGAILRWLRGYYAQHEVTNPPAPARWPTPISRFAFDFPPADRRPREQS